jgi:hypothetical protein
MPQWNVWLGSRPEIQPGILSRSFVQCKKKESQAQKSRHPEHKTRLNPKVTCKNLEKQSKIPNV